MLTVYNTGVNFLHSVQYPYLPEGRAIKYVSAADPFMKVAETTARELSLDSSVPTGSAIVSKGQVVAVAANGSYYHRRHACRRVELGIPTGQGYELCEGCHPKNHSEAKAVAAAHAKHQDISGAQLYLWGHWWCCQDCWNTMVSAGISDVFLLENSEVLFNKANPANILPQPTGKGDIA